MSKDIPKQSIQDLYMLLVNDKNRNSMIIDEVINIINLGRSPLILTERIEHLEYFAKELEKSIHHVIILKGGMGKRQRAAIFEQIKSVPANEERVIISTGRYAGEGFDDARIDTLFLALPISWKGTLRQYVGRLHRLHDDKYEVRVYDYVDRNVPSLFRMYKKRLSGYRAFGYTIDSAQETLF